MPQSDMRAGSFQVIGLLLLACNIFAGASDKRPPNIVLILADDLGWADLGCQGSPFYQTPHLDELAADGMRFTTAYAAPVCSPTRASVMTGKHPARLRLTDWLPGRKDMPSQKLQRPDIRQRLPRAEVTVAEILTHAGYATVAIGKWHLGGPGFGPTDQGFQLNIAGDHRGTPPGYFAPYLATNQPPLPGIGESEAGEYLTDRLTAEAEKFIEQNASTPFFLYLAQYAVHIPISAKTNLIEKYEAFRQPNFTHSNAVYAAMIESLDESAGRIVKKLEELNLTDRTLVIFTSDNGGLSVREGPRTPATSNAPLRAGKGHLYEGGLRVPLIIKWPGRVKPGSVTGTPVAVLDLFATMLDAAGQRHAARSGTDSISLMPLLEKSGRYRRDAIYTHYPHYSNQGGRPGSAIRESDFKLIEFFEDNHLELYNVAADIGETADLAKLMPTHASYLHSKLRKWRRRVSAQMMEPNPRYRPFSSNPAVK
ncbi:MAG: sulfatase [Verrucomicrobia subdivision 3 bacterium]|nr:sulfatase [Limisphaerales bacterium]